MIREMARMLVTLPNPLIVEPVHRFADGTYTREITVPAGSVIVGKTHKKETLNILLKGKAILASGGTVRLVEAPLTFVSEPGVQKAAFVLEEMTWLNVHPTSERDLEKIEDEFIEKDEELERLAARQQTTAIENKETSLCLG